MTVPGQAPPPAGWYPDPDGAPGVVRWWTGADWSDVTTPAGPGVAVRQFPAPAQVPSPAAAGAPDVFASPAPSRGTWRGLLIGLAVVSVVVVAVALVVTAGRDRAEPPVDSAVTSARPSGPAFPPGTVRIIDEAAGISYPYLGTGWSEYDLERQMETTSIAGQYFTTQENVPRGGLFIAQCTSGPVAPAYGWTGPQSLPTTMTALADSVRANYYPAPNERTVMRDEARTVDGHAARLYEFQLSWRVPGYDTTGERAALLLVDVGRPAPALLYLSIPNTHAELYGVIDRVLDDVDVL